MIKSYADKKSPYADVLKAANDELQKPGADPAAIHQKYAEQIHAIIKKETAAPEEPKNETPVPVKTALAPSGGPVLKDGNVITVDLGDNQGARALWKNENGSFTAVTAEDLIDNKMGEAAKYMPNSEAEATPLLDYINRVSKAYETVNDANDGTGPAHVDLSAKTKAEQDAAIEEMGRKNTESAPRVLQQQATTTQVYQPV